MSTLQARNCLRGIKGQGKLVCLGLHLLAATPAAGDLRLRAKKLFLQRSAHQKVTQLMRVGEANTTRRLQAFVVQKRPPAIFYFKLQTARPRKTSDLPPELRESPP